MFCKFELILYRILKLSCFILLCYYLQCFLQLLFVYISARFFVDATCSLYNSRYLFKLLYYKLCSPRLEHRPDCIVCKRLNKQYTFSPPLQMWRHVGVSYRLSHPYLRLPVWEGPVVVRKPWRKEPRQNLSRRWVNSLLDSTGVLCCRHSPSYLFTVCNQSSKHF